VESMARRLLDETRFLSDREIAENLLEGGDFRPYREVVAGSVVSAAARQGIALSDDEAMSVGASVGCWPPFADTAAALAVLGRGRRLAIVSNVERRDVVSSIGRIGVAFDEVVTAEDVRAYKPDRTPFDEVLRRLALPREKVLHVAQSLYHDIGPVATLGIDSIWIDRRGDAATDSPTYRRCFSDLAGMAEALGPAD
ncbi:MAG: HAD-IA family hydrolase, partial [Acidobacteriota bacterium]